jgi:hypothetical protein
MTGYVGPIEKATLYIASYIIAHNLRKVSLPRDHSRNCVSTTSSTSLRV